MPAVLDLQFSITSLLVFFQLRRLEVVPAEVEAGGDSQLLTPSAALAPQPDELVDD